MEAIGGGFVPVPDVKSQQEGISNEEFDLLKVKVKEALIAKLPEINEGLRQIAENNKKIEEIDKGYCVRPCYASRRPCYASFRVSKIRNGRKRTSKSC